MSTNPRTVLVNVLTTQCLEIDDPDWCAGHPEDIAQFKPDITHFGPEQAIEVNGFEVLRAMLAQSPYSQKSGTAVTLYVEEGSITGAYSPAEVEQLADALTESADRLRTLGRELARILAGGGQ